MWYRSFKAPPSNVCDVPSGVPLLFTTTATARSCCSPAPITGAEEPHNALVADGGSVLKVGGRYSGCGFVWRRDGVRGVLFDRADDIVAEACLKVFAFMVFI